MTRLPLTIAVLTLAVSGVGAQSLDGSWRSEGYGWVFDIRGDSLRAREVTAVSCIASFRAHRVEVPAGAVAAFTFDGSPTTLQVLSGPSADVMRLHLEGSASDYIIRRVNAAPAVCNQETAKDALTTFDVLWHNYAEHYPFFALKHVDWNAVRGTYRPRAATASPAELFDIFREMIEPLHDAHTFLVASDINRRTGGRRPDPDSIGASGRPRIAEIITSKYLRTPLRTWAQGRVSFGYLPDSIGYMRITGFAGYTQEGSYRSMLAALEAALDTIFADTRGWRGLVIDVRINGGGADPLGLAIASRLTAAPYTAYAKVARSDPRDPTKMTEPQVSVVSPSTRPGWRGPVAELTSRYSVSAAETFTQALMGRTPAIARVGEHTQGVFSDVLSRTLPNGWRIGLPNELFLTEQGTSFDGPGIPPTMPVPTFTQADLAAGRDPGLERAMLLLDSTTARFRRMSDAAEARGLAEPFLGITTKGTPRAGLFPLRSTGVSTAPVVAAARKFLAALMPPQLSQTTFAVDDPEWRKWMNQHFYVRQGVGFKDMTEDQREAALGLLGASLSAKGLKLTRDIMRLNHTLGELNNNNFVEYGEWLYWITLMGQPSETEPWGWQLDGHHVVINYFVLGDQVVMTPMFVGSEPVVAESGKYRGVSILQEEQNDGLAMISTLDEGQRRAAIIEVSKTGNNNLTEAFKDNVLLEYAGVAARTFTAAQKERLLRLIGLFVSNMKEGHARVRMSEVEAHLDSTHFAWIGGTDKDAVFYYRIHSPVILIEFDHQRPANLRRLYGERPVRQHIHAVVRTPNGNDYGKDLLKQHYQRHPHPH